MQQLRADAVRLDAHCEEQEEEEQGRSKVVVGQLRALWQPRDMWQVRVPRGGSGARNCVWAITQRCSAAAVVLLACVLCYFQRNMTHNQKVTSWRATCPIILFFWGRPVPTLVLRGVRGASLSGKRKYRLYRQNGALQDGVWRRPALAWWSIFFNNLADSTLSPIGEIRTSSRSAASDNFTVAPVRVD